MRASYNDLAPKKKNKATAAHCVYFFDICTQHTLLNDHDQPRQPIACQRQAQWHHTKFGAAQPMTADNTVINANAATAPAYTCVASSTLPSPSRFLLAQDAEQRAG